MGGTAVKIHNTDIPDVSDPDAVRCLLSDAHDRSGAAVSVTVHVMEFMDGDKKRYAPRIVAMAGSDFNLTPEWLVATLQQAAQRIMASPQPDERRA